MPAFSRQPDLAELLASIHRTPIATVITDNLATDNPIIEVNDAFVELTGYARDEIVGHNCRFLAGLGTEPEAQSVLRSAISHGQPAIVELTNYRKDGSPFRNAVMLAPVRDPDGAPVLFIGSQMDVGEARSCSGLRGRVRRTLLAS